MFWKGYLYVASSEKSISTLEGIKNFQLADKSQIAVQSTDADWVDIEIRKQIAVACAWNMLTSCSNYT